MARALRNAMLAVALAAGLTTVTAAWAALPQTVLKLAHPGGSIDADAVSQSYFAWSHHGSATHGHVWLSEQAMSGGLPAGKITNVSTTTFAYAGSISGTRLVYQQGGGIRFFNLVTHVHSNPPLGINTPEIEENPTATATWLLFDRMGGGSTRVLLYNFKTHSVRVLVRAVAASGVFASADRVNGNYAVYTVCRLVGAAEPCHEELYTISTRTTQQIPLAAGHSGDQDLGATVTPTGTLFFVREATGSCGAGDQLMKRPLGGPTTSLFTFKPKYTAGALDNYNDGSAQLIFDKGTCFRGEGVFRTTNP